MIFTYTTTAIDKTRYTNEDSLCFSFQVLENGNYHTEYIVEVNTGTNQVFWFSEIGSGSEEFSSLEEAKHFAFQKIGEFREEAIELESYTNPTT
jgi:hypothetical protein